MAIPTLLSQQGPGPAAQQAPSGVNVNEGAIGNYEGLSKFGQGVQQAGTSVGDALARKAHFAAELEKRKDQTIAYGITAAALEATRQTKTLTEKRQLEASGPNGSKPESWLGFTDKTWNDTFKSELKSRNIEEATAQNDKYAPVLGHRDSVNSIGQGLDDRDLTEMRVRDLSSVHGQTISDLTDDLGNVTVAPDYALSQVGGAFKAIDDFYGIGTGQKEQVKSVLRNKFALTVPQLAHDTSDERLPALKKSLVDIGFSDNDANMLTKRPTLGGGDVNRIADQAVNLAGQGDTKGAVAAMNSIKHSVTQGHADEINAQATLAGGMYRFDQLMQSEKQTLPQSQSMLQEIEADASGYAYVSRFLPPEALKHFSVSVLQSNQAKLKTKLSGRIEVLKTNPAQHIDQLPAMQPLITAVDVATTKLIGAVGGKDPTLIKDATTEFSKAQRQYSTMSAIHRSGMSVKGGDAVTPAVPNAVVNSMANNLANAPDSTQASTVLMSLSQSSPEGAQFSEAVARNLSGRSGNKSANKAGAAILAQLAAVNAGGPLNDEFNQLIAANAFNEEEASKAEQGLALAEPVDLRDAGKTMSMSKHADNLMKTVGISHNSDTVDKVFKQEQASSDLSQTAVRWAEGFATTNGIPVESAMALARTTILNSAAQAGSGVITQASLERATGNFVSAAAASGMITIKNAKTGQRELAYYPLKDSKIQGFFSPAEPGKINDVATLAEARQAVADVFVSESKLSTADRYGPILGHPINAFKTFANGKGAPLDIFMANAEQALNSWTRWNATLFGQDWGSPDIKPAYFNREVLYKLGFLPDAFAKEGGTFKMKNGQDLNYTEYVNRIHQIANPDGSVTISWKAGKSRAFDSRVDTGNSATGGEIMRVPANKVRAATDYGALQGTSADGSDSWSKTMDEAGRRIDKNIEFNPGKQISDGLRGIPGAMFHSEPGNYPNPSYKDPSPIRRSKTSVPATDAQIARDHQLSLVDRLLFLHKTK